MALDSDGTLYDDRDPVTLSGLREDQMAVTPKDLREAGSNVDIAASAEDLQAENSIGLTPTENIERLQALGWYTAEEAERRKKQLRANIEEAEQQEPKGLVSVEMVYNQPNISVSSSGRFKEHQTIDGPIVRQKIGEGNVEIEIEGVCTTPEAKVIDTLRFEGTITVLSDRYSGEVQIASTSTSPLEDGGAMNLDGQFTHTFGISCVEVE
ncbi:hypothetical protein M199_gp022 [Halogranum tailed virus 1]|uniref:Uncharacterized protein n=1 Tax=Halogranum tailed virus 1 TaxID=1273749 RepID=R4TL01_9CAUD|nr:hypothetical protein M199_gp022 [Halogranum tailed virus 1]AGM11352.1 hypothetical protein HGTV1_22 [Halogranum tailed virus 1]